MSRREKGFQNAHSQRSPKEQNYESFAPLYGRFRKLGVPYFGGPYSKDPTI